MIRTFFLRHANESLTRVDFSVPRDGELVCVIMGPQKALRGRISGEPHGRNVRVDYFDVGYTGSAIVDKVFVLPETYRFRPVALNHKFRLDVLSPGHMFAVTNQRFDVSPSSVGLFAVSQ